jgi:ABC-type phosphonate transport system ATPase subunit
MRKSGVTTDQSQDAFRIRWLLRELHLLGERPSTNDVRVHGGVREDSTPWSRHVAELWQERRATPNAAVRGDSPWRYPFAIPHGLVVEHRLEAIEERLGREVVAAKDSLVSLLAAHADDAEIVAAELTLRRQSTALRVWADTLLALRQSTEVLGDFRVRREPPMVTPHPNFPV